MSKLFVISAPSGAGKTTLIESLLEHSSNEILGLESLVPQGQKEKMKLMGNPIFLKQKKNSKKCLRKKSF